MTEPQHVPDVAVYDKLTGERLEVTNIDWVDGRLVVDVIAGVA